MKVLITGVAGFIGFNLASYLISSKKNIQVYGIDNVNSYYSTKLKKDRLIELKRNKNFEFFKFDLNNRNKLIKLFNKNKPDVVVHLAAQAGVQHSIKNPKKHIDDNVNSYFNLLDICRIKNIKKIIYASSSSIYGDNKKYPLAENAEKNPKNIYGLSKKFMEEMSEVYCELYGMQIVGMRFFSVFGEWGRPDMLILKYLNASINNKKFFLNNFGNHYRDFTYINDVVKIINLLIQKKIRKHNIFNVCSNNPKKITSIFKTLDRYVKKPKIIKRKFQEGDILKSHGNNTKIKNFVKFKNFANFNESLKKTIDWYFSYNKIKNRNIEK